MSLYSIDIEIIEAGVCTLSDVCIRSYKWRGKGTDAPHALASEEKKILEKSPAACISSFPPPGSLYMSSLLACGEALLLSTFM